MKKNIWIMNHYSIEHFCAKGGRHYWIAENLKKDGYAPVVFGCNVKHNDIGNYFSCNQLARIVYSDSNVPYVVIPSTPYNGNGIRRVRNMGVFAINLIRAAKAYGKKYGKPDVIYASSVHPLTLAAGLNLAKHYHVKCICEVRDLWPESLLAYGVMKEENPAVVVLRALEKRIYKKADALIFTMEGGYDYIKDQGWERIIPRNKVFYVNNGVDLSQFDFNKKTYAIEDEDLSDNNFIKIVYTGSIRKANDLHVVLDAAKLVKNDRVVFLFWGDGDELEELRRRVKVENIKNVKWKGKVDKRYIPSITSRADVNFMHGKNSSIAKYGYSSNKMFDYLAAGKPILTDICSPYNPVIQCGAAIEICNPTAENIAAAVDEISNFHADRLRELSQNAKNGAEQYDFTKLTNQLEDIVERL